MNKGDLVPFGFFLLVAVIAITSGLNMWLPWQVGAAASALQILFSLAFGLVIAPVVIDPDEDNFPKLFLTDIRHQRVSSVASPQ